MDTNSGLIEQKKKITVDLRSEKTKRAEKDIKGLRAFLATMLAIGSTHSESRSFEGKSRSRGRGYSIGRTHLQQGAFGGPKWKRQCLV